MKRLIFFIPLLFLISFSSCLDNNNIKENTNPHIERFYFNEHTKISGIENVTFIVDTIAGLIYNEDSVSMNCDFSRVVPVVDAYETFKSISINDKSWNYVDTIDMNNPIKINTVAGNKKNKASYIVTINKHTVEPDSIIWTSSYINENNISSLNTFAYEGKIYLFLCNNNSETKIYTSNGDENYSLVSSTSEIALDFNKSIIYNGKCVASSNDSKSLFYIDITNFAAGFNEINLPEGAEIIDLWGVLNNKLYCTLKLDAPYYMSYNGAEWMDENCNMLEELTATGSAKINNDNTLYVISGELNGKLTNNVLATQDGNYWINTINQADTLIYEPIKNACVVDYYNYFYLLGGKNSNGETPTSHYSKNDGYSWEPLKSYQRPANGFTAKENMAACVLNEYIYIFNCSKTSKIESWRGKINRADFIKK